MDWLTAAGLGLGIYWLLKPKAQASPTASPTPAPTLPLAPTLPPAQPPPYGPQYTPDPAPAPGLAPPTDAQLAGVAQYIRDYYNLPLLQTVAVTYNAGDGTLTIAYGGDSGVVEWASTYAQLFNPDTCEDRDPPFFGPCQYAQPGAPWTSTVKPRPKAKLAPAAGSVPFAETSTKRLR